MLIESNGDDEVLALLRRADVMVKLAHWKEMNNENAAFLCVWVSGLELGYR